MINISRELPLLQTSMGLFSQSCTLYVIKNPRPLYLDLNLKIKQLILVNYSDTYTFNLNLIHIKFEVEWMLVGMSLPQNLPINGVFCEPPSLISTRSSLHFRISFHFTLNVRTVKLINVPLLPEILYRQVERDSSVRTRKTIFRVIFFSG